MSVSQTVRGVAFPKHIRQDQLERVGFEYLTPREWSKIVTEADPTHQIERAQWLADATDLDWKFFKHQVWLMAFMWELFTLPYYPVVQVLIVWMPLLAFQCAIRPWIHRKMCEVFDELLAHGYCPTRDQIHRFHLASDQLEVVEQVFLRDGRILLAVGEETPAHRIKVNFCLIDHPRVPYLLQ